MARKAPGRLHAIVHIAGPWEDEPPVNGEPIIAQRCLRCDMVLAETEAPKAKEKLSPKYGFAVGTQVAIAEPEDARIKRYGIPSTRSLSTDEEYCDGRIG